MIKQHYFELMNRDIDGAISPAEQVELRKYLAENEEARSFYNELVVTSAKLRKVRQVEPPATLKESIMAALPAAHRARASVRQPKRDFWATAGNWLFPSPSATLAVGVVAGALVMFFTINVLDGTHAVTDSQVGGTMLPNATTTMQLVNRQTITAGTASLVIESRRRDADIAVSVQVSTTEPSSVHLSFDSADLDVRGLSGPLGVENIHKTGSSIEFSANDDRTIELVFRDLTSDESAVRVNISQGNDQSSGLIPTGTAKIHNK